MNYDRTIEPFTDFTMSYHLDYSSFDVLSNRYDYSRWEAPKSNIDQLREFVTDAARLLPAYDLRRVKTAVDTLTLEIAERKRTEDWARQDAALASKERDALAALLSCVRIARASVEEASAWCAENAHGWHRIGESFYFRRESDATTFKLFFY